MIATVTSKGRISMPLAVRTRLNLKAGDQIEFDESAPVLTARRVIDLAKWKNTFDAMQAPAAKSLKGHPWQKMSSSEMLDDMRREELENIVARQQHI